MNASYTFRLFRPHEVWRDAWIEYLPDRRVNFRLGSESGMAILASLMVQDGYQDGDVEITEVAGQLGQYLESLHLLAANFPTAPLVSTPVYNALILLDKNPETWQQIDCKADLVGRRFVAHTLGWGDPHKASASLTEAGRQAIARYGKPIPKAPVQPKVDQPTTISTASYTGLRYVQMGAWASVHQAAKTGLVNRAFVLVEGTDVTVTEAGQIVLAEYEAVHGVPKIRLPEPKEKAVTLTPNQVQAFKIVTKHPYNWNEVPTRTANVMVELGWVTVVDDFPKKTPQGIEVYDAWLAASLEKSSA